MQCFNLIFSSFIVTAAMSVNSLVEGSFLAMKSYSISVSFLSNKSSSRLGAIHIFLLSFDYIVFIVYSTFYSFLRTSSLFLIFWPWRSRTFFSRPVSLTNLLLSNFSSPFSSWCWCRPFTCAGIPSLKVLINSANNLLVEIALSCLLTAISS